MFKESSLSSLDFSIPITKLDFGLFQHGNCFQKTLQQSDSLWFFRCEILGSLRVLFLDKRCHDLNLHSHGQNNSAA